MAHVEAGLRSFNPTGMPEETNRVVNGHHCRTCCSVQAIPRSKTSQPETLIKNIHLVGDIMLDISQIGRRKKRYRFFGNSGEASSQEKGFLTATIHRSENTDDISRLSGILQRAKCS